MSLSHALYPANPSVIPLSATDPSENFKKEVKKVLGSILLFFLVYLFLIFAAAVLAVGCLIVGFMVMTRSGHLIGIIAGVGIMSIGIMVFIFLIKFIFSVKRTDESGMIAVTEKEQPLLFAFIRQLTADTHTQFPKKIVLSPEVNASVFYNDSFWSMIFPVRKNLLIGLGLVNSLTLSEFKAVMAHEFGHFSQRSMKLGSFVYNVNKAIYNMLYENKDYSNFLQKWGNLHWAIGIFVWLTIQIVEAIQQILQSMYSLINKNYMGLSREMEFHADAVAASVSGSNSLIAALQKIEISDMCYQTVLLKADELIGEKARMQNVYQNHDEVMATYALHNNLPLQNNTPVADEEFFKKFQYHKINITNQWASHPPREERGRHLLQLDIKAVNDNRPAWVVFSKPEELQQQLSAVLYKSVPVDLLEQNMSTVAFKERYQRDIETFSLPALYNQYYNDRQVNDLDLNLVLGQLPDGNFDKVDFDELFSDEWVAHNRNLAGCKQDIEMLQAIIEDRIEVKTFDYAGVKMEKAQAPVLLEQLNNELVVLQKKLQAHEEYIVAFFYKAAMRKDIAIANCLKEKYEVYFKGRKNATVFVSAGQRILELLSPLLSGRQVSIESAERMAQSLRAESSTLKPLLTSYLEDDIYLAKALLQQRVGNFLSGDYHYFSNTSFLKDELDTLHTLVIETPGLLAIDQFKHFKEILVYQLEIYENR